MTSPGQVISRATLHDFRVNVLDGDDVLCSEFYRNVVFYGSSEAHLTIEPDFQEELAGWNTANYVFAKSSGPECKVPQGPYVFFKGKTWEPWRVYVDSNAAFMTTFKPSADNPGR